MWTTLIAGGRSPPFKDAINDAMTTVTTTKPSNQGLTLRISKDELVSRARLAGQGPYSHALPFKHAEQRLQSDQASNQTGFLPVSG
jgi:hypothetical protein